MNVLNVLLYPRRKTHVGSSVANLPRRGKYVHIYNFIEYISVALLHAADLNECSC